MDGLNATRHIMNVIPTPIVVVANSVYSADYNIAFSAIEAGALTVIEKPRGLGTSDYETVRAELLMALRTMSGVKLIRRMPATVRSDETGPMTSMLLSLYTHSIQVVAIGSSTGGPGVLKQIFSSLPKDFSIPIAVVQHITPAFATGMADWLNSSSNLQVSVPIEGERLMPGKIFMAPAGAHLTIGAGGFIHLDYSEPVKGLRPSASRLFSSVASAFGDDSIGIIMTGMGDDGVDGLVSLSKAGAHVIAQDEVSSVVFGMNKTAIERGIVDEVLSPEGIITRLTKLHRHMQTLSRLK
jgi:two-component system chemotaxis response regulator CheB